MINKLRKSRTEKRVVGDAGEDYACKYLKRKGYKILERNFSSKFGEIDIIAANSKNIAFVEVKTRHLNPMVRPCLAVTKEKQLHIMRTAYIYLREHKVKLQPRFDIAEVYLKYNTAKLYRINYITGAFMQEGDYADF